MIEELSVGFYISVYNCRFLSIRRYSEIFCRVSVQTYNTLLIRFFHVCRIPMRVIAVDPTLKDVRKNFERQ